MTQAKAVSTPGQVVVKMKGCAAQTHLWHLQTKSYAEHMALGAFYEKMNGLIDALSEMWLAEPEIRFDFSGTKIEPRNYDGDPRAYFMELKDWINMSLRYSIPPNRGDMKNTVDEIMALTCTTIYLLGLK